MRVQFRYCRQQADAPGYHKAFHSDAGVGTAAAPGDKEVIVDTGAWAPGSVEAASTWVTHTDRRPRRAP